jgi:hypothetical protein
MGVIFLFFGWAEVRARGVQKLAGWLQQSRKFTREWTRMDANEMATIYLLHSPLRLVA